MISLTKLRELDLAAPPMAGRPPHVSAASGLVCVKSFFYVVADDELHLGVFRAGADAPGQLIRIFDGALPEGTRKRKKRKPDFEALTVLPASPEYPFGALLALGSGSKPNRRLGALLALDADGAAGRPLVIDLSAIFVPLDDALSGLNIEGAVVCGEELRLFQRGNRKNSGNAVVRMRLRHFLDATLSENAVTPSFTVSRIDLGQIGGIDLTFTDATALPDGEMVFTAIAEDSDNAYDDGPCVGAAIGILGVDGKVRTLWPLDPPYKIEGISAHANGDALQLLLVTDADDAEIPASLFSTRIRWPLA